MPKKNPTPSPLEVARHSAGLTRKQLSEKTGIPFRTLEAYEQGKNDINTAAVASVKKIADVLGVPIEKIINETKCY